jgi:hypothetical protein
MRPPYFSTIPLPIQSPRPVLLIGFCGEKGFKDPLGISLTDSRVCEIDGKTSPLRNPVEVVAHREAQLASIRHRLKSIRDQVQEDLMQLARKAPGRKSGKVPLSG